MREKLIELLLESIRVDTEKKEAWILGGKVGEMPSVFENMADHIIANDVVPVVRCKDCKHYTEKRNKAYDGHYCERIVEFVQPNDFCSYGEKRDDR